MSSVAYVQHVAKHGRWKHSRALMHTPLLHRHVLITTRKQRIHQRGAAFILKRCLVEQRNVIEDRLVGFRLITCCFFWCERNCWILDWRWFHKFHCFEKKIGPLRWDIPILSSIDFDAICWWMFQAFEQLFRAYHFWSWIVCWVESYGFICLGFMIYYRLSSICFLWEKTCNWWVLLKICPSNSPP